MHVELHPHASERLSERGATQAEVIDTVLRGEHFAAKFNRMGFRKVFVYDGPGETGSAVIRKSRRLPLKSRPACSC